MNAFNKTLSDIDTARFIERKLYRLLAKLMPVFNSSEIREVTNYIDLGEYGLALQVAVDIIEEKKKQPSQDAFESLYDLAKTLDDFNIKYVKAL